tara:strand:+ start:56 stop:187 length:132 start_codon:yes stop_codon:yes gene_type:complete
MKLYWRVKIDGKWTYKAATIDKEFFEDEEMKKLCVCVMKELKE